MFNQNRKGKLSTATPLFYIYCCSAFLAMDLTNEIIEQKGFKRINNSMWRMNDITLQNGYTHEGKTIHERILNTKKAYKVCVFGKYLCMTTTVKDIDEIIEHMG